MPRTRSLGWTELKVGILSVVAIGIAATVIFMVSGEGGFFWQRYTLKAKFDNVAGLKPGAPVRVAGVEVGTVEDVAFDGTDVEVTFQLSREMQPRITTNSVAMIGSVSLLGEASLDLTISSDGHARPRLRLRAEPAHARPAGRRRGRRNEIARAGHAVDPGHPCRQGHGGQAVYRRDALP